MPIGIENARVVLLSPFTFRRCSYACLITAADQHVCYSKVNIPCTRALSSIVAMTDKAILNLSTLYQWRVIEVDVGKLFLCYLTNLMSRGKRRRLPVALHERIEKPVRMTDIDDTIAVLRHA